MKFPRVVRTVPFIDSPHEFTRSAWSIVCFKTRPKCPKVTGTWLESTIL